MNQKLSEQIERYLAGEMPEVERNAFEAELERDPTLAEAMTLHRSLKHTLGNRQRRHLLDALADVVAQEETKSPVLVLKWLSPARLAAVAAVLALVAAVGVWLYSPAVVEQPAVAEQPASQSAPVSDSAQTTIPTSPTKPKPAPAPLASTDRRAFAPNQALDPLVGTLVRGGNAGILVTTPKNDVVFPIRNGKIKFALAGTAGESTELILHIYNNREADFNTGNSKYQFEVAVSDQTFDWESTLQLPPGRYYAVLTMPDEEEPIVVLRFYVRSR